MVLATLAWLPLVSLIQAESVAPNAFDQVIELEITGDDAELVDGFGPTIVIEYDVEFDGTLHIWTRSDLDLFLRVEDALEVELLKEDDGSGGGKTPYVRLELSKGDLLAIFVAARVNEKGPLEVYLVAAPDGADSRAWAALAREELTRPARPGNDRDPGDFRESLNSILGSLDLVSGSVYSQSVADALWNLGIAAHGVGGVDLSLRAWKQVLGHRERCLSPDHPELLRAKGNVALSMETMGDLRGARALKESVLEAFERTLPPDHPDILQSRANLAVSLSRMGEVSDARAIQEQVLLSYERTLPPDHSLLLLARVSLASSLHRMGDLAAARALGEAALAGYERTLPADHPDILRAQGNLAVSMNAMGDSTGARALEEAVLESRVRTQPADHPALLSARGNLAVSMQASGDVAEAHRLFKAVFEAYERTLPADHPEVLRAHGNLAASMERVGALADLRQMCEAVVSGYERTVPVDHPQLLRARANLAAVMKDAGESSESHRLQKSVVSGYVRTLPADHPDRLSAQSALAISAWELDDHSGARALLAEHCAGIRDRVLASLALSPRQARQGVGSEAERLAVAYFLSRPADSQLQPFVFELTETMRLVASEAARSLTQSDAHPDLAAVLRESAGIRRALNDLVAGPKQAEIGPDELATTLTQLSLERDRLESVACRTLAELGVATEPVETEALAAALGPEDAAIGYRRIARWDMNEASGRIEAGADHLIAHILTSRGQLDRLDLGPTSELENLVDAWRRTLGAPLSSRGVGIVEVDDEPEVLVGSALRARVLDPILARVTDDVTRLFICADDLLFLVPLDALPASSPEASTDGTGPQRVGDRIRIVNEVSFARLLAPTRKLETAPSLLALGGVEYGAAGAEPERHVGSSAPIEAGRTNGQQRAAPGESEPGEEMSSAGSTSRGALPWHFPDLPNAGFEVEATAELFKEAFGTEPTLLTKSKTTKAALFQTATGKRFLHLATHGWFAPETIRSTEDSPAGPVSSSRMGFEQRVTGLAPMTLCGLALAGANHGRDSLGRVVGLLTAEELCALDLANCELAVLSACETNLGIRRAGQGIQSLQSALYAAGARTSITSLWKVDDAATRRLMEVFYTNLWIEHLPKAEALWQAKQALRDEGHPPAHWAGWVLTGDPE